MKKIYLSITTLLSSYFILAQNVTDALRYSTEDMNGTARYKAMSGAFGALGGDFSAIGINPAGSGMYSGSEIGFTFGNTSLKNNNTYFGTQTSSKSSDFDAGQFGVVFAINNSDKKSEWKKFALGFNYQNTKNFNAQDLKFMGNTSSANLGDYFLHYANGIEQQILMLDNYENKKPVGKVPLQELYDDFGNARLYSPFRLRNALLGYTVGLVTSESGKTSINELMSDAEADAVLQERTYVKNISNNANTEQRFEQIVNGGMQRYNFNFSTQYGNKLYFGVNLNSHSINYKSFTKHYERYANNTAATVTGAYFQNELRTTGSGFSFQLGVIAKLMENARLGISYQSPTWYSLQEETSQYLQASTSDRGIFYANPEVIVVYPEYKFRTPGSWTGSLAYIFGRKGLISFDYIYKDYGNIYFRSNDLREENTIVQNLLGGTSSVRLGGEYRIEALSLRVGIRYEQSPYKGSTKYVGDLNGYSFGAGYSFGGIRLDVSYDIAKQDNMFQMYESVLTTPVKVSSTQNNLMFTLSAKLF